MSERGHDHSVVAENFESICKKMPKELAVWIWENFLKRFANGESINGPMPDEQLKKELSEAVGTEKAPNTFSLASVNKKNYVEESFAELKNYLRGEFDPKKSHLYRRELIGRPKGYDQLEIPQEYLFEKAQSFPVKINQCRNLLAQLDGWDETKKQRGIINENINKIVIRYNLLMSGLNKPNSFRENSQKMEIIDEDIENIRKEIIELSNL